MNISLTSSRANGFKKWSDAHAIADNDDNDNSGGATPIAVTEPPSEERDRIEEPPQARLMPVTDSSPSVIGFADRSQSA